MKSLRRLVPYIKPHWHLVLISGLTAIPLSALRMGPVPLVQKFVDDLLVSKDPSKLILFPLSLIGLFLANFLVRFPHYYCNRIVVARVNQGLKNNLYDHLMGLSADYFTAQSTGTLISRVGTDTQYIDGGIAALNSIIREPITLILLFSYATYLNWRLTLVTLIIVPPMAWVFSATGRNLKRYILRMQEENARLFSTLQESFTGIRVVQSFRLEKYLQRKFRERSNTFTRYLLKTAILEEVSHPMVELLTSFALAALVYYGGSQVLSGQMSSGELLAFVFAFGMMMNPLRLLNDINIKISAAASACDRIFEVFDWKSHLREAPTPKTLSGFQSELEFKEVRFSYPDTPKREILKGIDFKLKKGGSIAFVGASGAGKSSLVGLIPRVFDITHGSILLDGVDIREISLDELRKKIAIVSQDVFLFNDTIEENIRCGRLGSTPEEIREAARRAHALDFIERMPLGFKTIIGDRGQKLSGGERQRLSIARAFLRQSPILILDEATSSLDSESERIVQSALEDLMLDRTVIIIAHRLSTIKNAQEIVVMDEGQVIERGSHSQLVALGGQYHQFIAASQLGDLKK